MCGETKAPWEISTPQKRYLYLYKLNNDLKETALVVTAILRKITKSKVESYRKHLPNMIRFVHIFSSLDQP